MVGRGSGKSNQQMEDIFKLYNIDAKCYRCIMTQVYFDLRIDCEIVHIEENVEEE